MTYYTNFVRSAGAAGKLEPTAAIVSSPAWSVNDRQLTQVSFFEQAGQLLDNVSERYTRPHDLSAGGGRDHLRIAVDIM